MHTLRNASRLTRLVLAWFVLSLGVAVAAPIVKPQDILLVCGGSGAMKVLVKSADDGGSEPGSTGMDCPLCMPLGAPPPSPGLEAMPPPPSQQVAIRATPADTAACSTAPPPARGPPTL